MLSKWRYMSLTALALLIVGSPPLHAQSARVFSISTVAGAAKNTADGVPPLELPLYLPSDLAFDAQGNLYFTSLEQGRVRKMSPDGQITTVAGTGADGFSGDGGPGSRAQVNGPQGVAIDAAGNVFFADSRNQRVRKVTPDGVISTVAGSGPAGFAGDGGPATQARLLNPQAVAVDPAGNLYVGDHGNFRVRKVSTDGVISTIAGTGTPGTVAGARAIDSQLPGISDLAFYRGKLYIAEGNIRVRVVNEDGTMSIYAGNGNGGIPANGSVAATSPLDFVRSLAFDSSGNLFLSANTSLFRISAQGTISTVAGVGRIGYSTEGPALETAINVARGIAVNTNGDVYFCDQTNRIRKLSGNRITIVAGADSVGRDGSPALDATVGFPIGLSIDRQGTLFFAEQFSYRLRRISPGGQVSVAAGTGSVNGSGETGIAAAGVAIATPWAVEADNNGGFYHTTGDARIRRVDAQGVTRIISGTGSGGFSGDGGLANSAQLTSILGLKLDTRGNLYFSDGPRIRRISSAGVISTIAGRSLHGFAGDGGPATDASLNFPEQLALDSAGNLYIADRANHRIRRISPGGIISTVAGIGLAGFAGDGGPAVNARLSGPRGVAVDSRGNLYIADTNNLRIRTVDRQGIITTVAGAGRSGFSGDGGPATAALMSNPFHLTVDAEDNIYFADRLNHRIRKLTALTPGRLTMVGGDNQKALVGAVLDQPLAVRVTSASGIALAGLGVRFEVMTGVARLQSNLRTTSADGVASVVVTLGDTPGAIEVRASVEGLPPLTFKLTAEAVGATGLPEISAIIGAGRSIPSVTAAAPNGRIAIVGSRLASAAREAGPDDIVEGRYPSKLEGVCATVGGQAAPIVAVAANQITAIVPAGAAGEVEVQVLTDCGGPAEARSNAVMLTVQTAAPEFLYWVNNPDGANPIRAVLAEGGRAVGPAGMAGVEDAAPAAAGDEVILSAIGLGATDPPLEAGQVIDQPAAVTQPVEVIVDGEKLAAEDVFSVSARAGAAGIYDIRIRIPASADSGRATVVVRVGGFQSPDGAFLQIK
ncbi:MAG: hypothetical protein SFV51_16430 [Bryobacteraceae bacterium]|nr:hypothetical protein [Bryobacteraceae bacterium]